MKQLILDPWTLDAATAAVAAVLDVHGCKIDYGQAGWYGMDRPTDGRYCTECGVVTEYAVAWPCRTVVAVLEANGADLDDALARADALFPLPADFAAAGDRSVILRVAEALGYGLLGIHSPTWRQTTAVHVIAKGQTKGWFGEDLTQELGHALDAYVPVIIGHEGQTCHDCS